MLAAPERKFFLWGLLFLAVISVLTVLKPFLLSMATGAIFAFSFFPLRDYLERKWGHHRILIGSAVGTGFVLVVLAPIILLSLRAIGFLEGRASNGQNPLSIKPTLGNFATKVTVWFESTTGFDIPFAQIRGLLDRAEDFIVGGASAALSQIPDATVQVCVMVITLYAVLCHKPFAIKSAGPFVKKWSQTIIEVTVGASRDVILANILTGFVQAAMVTLAAAVFTDAPLSFIFVFTFTLSFIPVIGAAPVAAVLGVMELFNDNGGAAIGLFISCLVVGTADNFIRAYFISRDRNDSQFLNFVGTLGGIYIWGIAGLFIGPTIVSVSVRLIPRLTQRLVNGEPGRPKSAIAADHSGASLST